MGKTDKRAAEALRLTLEEREKERAVDEKRWAQVESHDKFIRKLCLDIIAKWNIGREDIDSSLKKGAINYEKLPTDKLITEANAKRREYDEERTNLMKGLFDELAEARREIEDLKVHKEIDDNTIVAKKNEIHKLKLQLIEATKNSSGKSNEKKIETHTVVSVSEEDKIKAKALILEAESISEKKEIKDLSAACSKLKKNKHNATQEKVDEIVEELTNGGKNWEKPKILFNIIGQTGLSIKNDIEAEYAKRIREVSKSNNTPVNILYSLNKLVEIGILTEGTFSYFNGTLKYYLLTGLGSAAYFKIRGKEAADSQYSKVCAAHANPRHGYGIIYIANLMREYPERFSNISEFNKGNMGKTLEVEIIEEVDGEKKVTQCKIEPDIAFDEGKSEKYIEYELVTQTSDEYNRKIEKYIMHGEKELYFIFPEIALKESFEKTITQYLAAKKKSGVDFSDVKFYLYTIDEFKNMCEMGEPWEPWNKKKETKEDIPDTTNENYNDTINPRKNLSSTKDKKKSLTKGMTIGD